MCVYKVREYFVHTQVFLVKQLRNCFNDVNKAIRTR